MTATLIGSIALMGVGTPAIGEQPAAPKHVAAALICEQQALVPGATAMLGLDFTIEKKWHIYSNCRNDNSVPPTADFELPAGFTVDAIQWPTPIRHIEPGEMLNHVYEDHVTLMVPLHVPSSAQPGSTITVKAKVNWLVCDRICVLEKGDVQITLPIAKPGEVPGKSAEAKTFDQARARMPRELPKDAKEVSIAWDDKAVAVSVPGAAKLFFYPDEDCVPFAEPIKDGEAAGSKLTIRLGDPEPDHTALAGVLEIRRDKDKSGGDTTQFYRVRSAPPAKTLPTKTIPDKPVPKSP